MREKFEIMCVVYMYGCMNAREVRDYVRGVYVLVYGCERSSRLCAWCICMGVWM